MSRTPSKLHAASRPAAVLLAVMACAGLHAASFDDAIYVGFRVGFTASAMSYAPDTIGDTARTGFGLQFGAVLGFPVAEGLRLEMDGVFSKYHTSVRVDDANFYDRSVTALELPVFVTYDVAPALGGMFHIDGGLQFSIIASVGIEETAGGVKLASTSVGYLYNVAYVAFLLGGGVRMGDGISIDLRYAIPLGRAYDTPTQARWMHNWTLSGTFLL